MSDSEKKETPSGFTLWVRPEDHIIVTKLKDFSRRTVEAWMGYVRAHDGNLKPPVRLLYDFQEAGPPSRYVLDVIGPFMDSLIIPEDTRSAYVFVTPFERFAGSFVRRLPAKAGAVRAFASMDEAVAWLLLESID